MIALYDHRLVEACPHSDLSRNVGGTLTSQWHESGDEDELVELVYPWRGLDDDRPSITVSNQDDGTRY